MIKHHLVLISKVQVWSVTSNQELPLDIYREWGMSLCDDPQRIRHAQVLSIIYLFIHRYLARIFTYNILLEIS